MVGENLDGFLALTVTKLNESWLVFSLVYNFVLFHF